MTKNTLHKDERLKSKKAIELLFRNGKAMFSPPFRVLYRISALDNSVQEKHLKMTVAIPKKMIKLAVNRNLLKRRTREIYRQNNAGLQEALLEKNLKIELLFLYQTSDILDYAVLSRAATFLLLKLEKEIRSTTIHY